MALAGSGFGFMTPVADLNDISIESQCPALLAAVALEAVKAGPVGVVDLGRGCTNGSRQSDGRAQKQIF